MLEVAGAGTVEPGVLLRQARWPPEGSGRGCCVVSQGATFGNEGSPRWLRLEVSPTAEGSKIVGGGLTPDACSRCSGVEVLWEAGVGPPRGCSGGEGNAVGASEGGDEGGLRR